MNFKLSQNKLSNLRLQRNIFLSSTVLFCGICILETSFLLVAKEKIIILPPETKKGFWIEGNKFSPSYLEEQAMFFAHLLLDVSAGNIFTQGEILLRYVDSRYYGDFHAKLLAEKKKLEKESLSLSFHPTDCEVFPKYLKVKLIGELHGYVGGKRITSKKHTYIVQFSNKHGRLMLARFLEEENNNVN